MELYLIRHGIAVEQDRSINDQERSLTDEGRKKTKKVAHRLQDLGLQFDLILTSPLVRSRQTAEIFYSANLSSRLEDSSDLAPNGNIYAWLDWLKQYPGFTNLALVGHQPNLADWAEILIWGQTKARLELKKAGIIGLSLPDSGSPVGESQLFWLTAPKFLL